MLIYLDRTFVVSVHYVVLIISHSLSDPGGRAKLDGGRKCDVAESHPGYIFGRGAKRSTYLYPSFTPNSASVSSIVVGPSYTMRSVALSVLFALAATSVSASEDPKPVFKACFYGPLT